MILSALCNSQLNNVRATDTIFSPPKFCVKNQVSSSCFLSLNVWDFAHHMQFTCDSLEMCCSVYFVSYVFFMMCCLQKMAWKTVFFQLKKMSSSCHVVMSHWWAHDMEWINPCCRNTYIFCGSFPWVLGCLLLGYAWLHRWQCGLAEKVGRAVLQDKPNWKTLLCETEEMEL